MRCYFKLDNRTKYYLFCCKHDQNLFPCFPIDGTTCVLYPELDADKMASINTSCRTVTLGNHQLWPLITQKENNIIVIIQINLNPESLIQILSLTKFEFLTKKVVFFQIQCCCDIRVHKASCDRDRQTSLPVKI